MEKVAAYEDAVLMFRSMSVEATVLLGSALAVWVAIIVVVITCVIGRLPKKAKLPSVPVPKRPVVKEKKAPEPRLSVELTGPKGPMAYDKNKSKKGNPTRNIKKGAKTCVR
eukprot:7013949-Pyramimonas_sp.AAC.1